MLVNMDIPWVIIGHSERRLILGESNEVSHVFSCPIDIENHALILRFVTMKMYFTLDDN